MSCKLISAGIALSLVAVASASAQTTYIGASNPLPPNPANACVTSICGPAEAASNFMGRYLKAQNAFISAMQEDPSKVQPPTRVLALYRELDELDAQTHQVALEALADNRTDAGARLEGAYLSFLNLTAVGRHFSKVQYKKVKDGDHETMAIDEAKSRAELRGLPRKDQDWILEIMRYGLKKYEFSPYSDEELATVPPPILLKMQYPKLTPKEAARLEIAKMKRNLEKIKDAHPLEKNIYFQKMTSEHLTALEEKVEKGTISETEVRGLLKWNIDFGRTYLDFSDPNNPIRKRNGPLVKDLLKKAGDRTKITARLEQERTERLGAQLNQRASCLTQYQLNLRLLPTKAQRDQLAAEVPRAKTRVMKTIEESFPRGAKQIASDAVNDTDFILVPTADEYEAELIQSLERMRDSKKKSLESLKTTPVSQIQGILAATMSLPPLPPEKKPTSSKDPNRKNPFCSGFDYDPFSDANYTGLGQVILSFSTASANEDTRYMVIQHELGHSATRAVEAIDKPEVRAWVAATKSCLASLHAHEPAPVPDYYREDIADAVAGARNQTPRKKNPFCEFTSTSGKEYEASSLLNYPDDPHSADLFRLLHFEYLHKGGLTDACDKYLKRGGMDVKFRHCLDLTPGAGPSAPLAPAKATR